MCCLHFREYKDKIRQKNIRTYDEIGGLFYQKKKLHNTENSTLNHKNVDSVDPEESYIHTYTFKFKIGIFFCQKPIMFFCSLSLKKKEIWHSNLFSSKVLNYILCHQRRNQINRLLEAKDQWRRRWWHFSQEKNILVHKKNCSKEAEVPVDHFVWLKVCQCFSKMEQLFIRTWQFWPHYEKQNGSIWQKSTDAKCFLPHPPRSYTK